MRSAPLLAAILTLSVVAGGCLSKVIGGGGDPGPTDYVTAKTYTKWVIEVDSVQGQGPPSGLLDFVKTRLSSVANKPDGIEMRVDETAMAPHNGAWSVKDIEQVSKAHQGAHTSGTTAVLHLMFLDGNSQGDSQDARVLGSTLTYSNGLGHVSSTGPIAIFSQSIKDSCSPISLNPCTDAAPIWRGVLVHEFGHAMGLVNNGIPMVKNHEATSCNGSPDQKHSSNTNSVMNCQVESGNVLAAFTGGIPNDYDADDKADLHAAGGR